MLAPEPDMAAAPATLGSSIDAIFCAHGRRERRLHGVEQVARQLGHVLRALVGVAQEALHDHGLELGRDVGPPRSTSEGGGRFVDSSAQMRVNVGRSNGRAARQHLVQDRADGPDVGPRVDVGRAEQLLGGHVLGGAEDDARLRQLVDLGLAGSPLGDAEVQDLQQVGPVGPLGEKQVRGLEIAVDDAVRVRLGDADADLHGVVDGRADGQRPLALDQLPEIAALQVVHDHVGDALFPDAHVDDARDVLVLSLALTRASRLKRVWKSSVPDLAR